MAASPLSRPASRPASAALTPPRPARAHVGSDLPADSATPSVDGSNATSARSPPLIALTLFASLFFLQWARPVLVPIAASVMLSYALTPIVRWLERRLRLHSAIGAAVAVSTILAALGYGATVLQPKIITVLDIVPDAVEKLTLTWRGSASSSEGAIEKLRRAATELEHAADLAASDTSKNPSRIVAKPAMGSQTINLRDYVFAGTAGVIAAAGELIVVVCLVYFLLATGDAFRRTLVRISGDTLTKKKITVQILDDIDAQIQRYLLVQLTASALLGFVSWA